jgi:hypothetical protein
VKRGAARVAIASADIPVTGRVAITSAAIDMRIVAVCALAFSLAACTPPQRQAEQAAVRASTTDCLARETRAVAPQPIDLETAALAVLARCDYPGVIERPLAAQYPGYRDVVREEVRKSYADRLEIERREIAMLRAQGASRSGQ